jgi:thiamine biosynthesis lipoprotein
MTKCSIDKRLMGSAFELIVVAENEAKGDQLLQEGIAEIQRLEALLTEFNDHSQTAQLNKQAGIAPVQVDEEVYQLIKRSIHISSLTQGAFDITAGALKQLYNFKNKQLTFPGKSAINKVLQSVGYKKIQLGEDGHIMLQEPGMHIGFGAIGKGYAADKVKALWLSKGVTSGVINASGDLTAWGQQPNGEPWKVGIADPSNIDNVLLWLPVDNASVATSGNYEQYFDLDGIRYSHNIDPRTGMPAKFIKSVTIISMSAELSDALATAVTIMGVEAGLYFIDQLPNVHCIIIDKDNKIHRSKKIEVHV